MKLEPMPRAGPPSQRCLTLAPAVHSAVHGPKKNTWGRCSPIRPSAARRAEALTDKDPEMAKTLLANPDITVDQVAGRRGIAHAALHRCLPQAVEFLVR
jgi:hypothetical protein